MLLDKFHNKYIIKGVITAKAPIHIGIGDQDFDPLQVDNAVIRDENNNPYIPGSSLKGALRSWVEMIIGNGIYEDYRACLIVNNPCDGNKDEVIKKIKEVEKKSNKEKEIPVEEKIAQNIYDKMCDVCKVFGGKYFAAKLKINDCKTLEEKVFVQKKDGTAISRETGTAADNHKYDFEQVSVGTRFDFYMTIDNLEDRHINLLKLIISLLENGELKVGGKTSVGLGNIQLTDIEIYKVSKDNFKEYVLCGLSEEMRWKNV